MYLVCVCVLCVFLQVSSKQPHLHPVVSCCTNSQPITALIPSQHETLSSYLSKYVSLFPLLSSLLPNISIPALVSFPTCTPFYLYLCYITTCSSSFPPELLSATTFFIFSLKGLKKKAVTEKHSQRDIFMFPF